MGEKGVEKNMKIVKFKETRMGKNTILNKHWHFLKEVKNLSFSIRLTFNYKKAH